MLASVVKIAAGTDQTLYKLADLVARETRVALSPLTSIDITSPCRHVSRMLRVEMHEVVSVGAVHMTIYLFIVSTISVTGLPAINSAYDV